MAEFILNQTVATRDSSVEVTIAAGKELPVGRHTFQLIVADDSGNKSVPTTVTVIVADTQAPTAVLVGPRIATFGQSFKLDGSQSFDVGGGRVVEWDWTYLGPAT